MILYLLNTLCIHVISQVYSKVGNCPVFPVSVFSVLLIIENKTLFENSSQNLWTNGLILLLWVNVTSCNTHVTLLTNLSQFRTCHIPWHTPCTSSTSELI